jgi:peptidoglycan-associated lipoprotein
MRNLGHRFAVIGVAAFFSVYGGSCATRSALKAEQGARMKAEQEARIKAEEAQRAQEEVARLKAELEDTRKAAEDASMEAKKVAGSLEDTREGALTFEDIHFDFDGAALTPEATEKLTRYVVALKQYPEVKVRIEGHCDERGTTEYNLALGERRALSARRFLIKAGIEKIRLSTVSYGEERPLDPRHNEEAWAKNRRDHFVVSP